MLPLVQLFIIISLCRRGPNLFHLGFMKDEQFDLQWILESAYIMQNLPHQHFLHVHQVCH